MGEADQVVALILFTVIGGAVGARLTRGQYWRGALATAVAVGVTSTLFISLGATSPLLSILAVAAVIIAVCGALRMKGIQIFGTIIGAQAGLALVQAFLFWTSQGAG